MKGVSLTKMDKRRNGRPDGLSCPSWLSFLGRNAALNDGLEAALQQLFQCF
jgi:hypothetical protein